MTDAQQIYVAARDAGQGHAAALATVARQLAVDEGTARRVLGRADDDDARRGAPPIPGWRRDLHAKPRRRGRRR